MPERASVAVSFLFGVGSRLEDSLDAGLAHFLEHMVFKGGGEFPTARAVSEAIEGIGGTINAGTDRESTAFWSRVPAEHTEVAVRVLADILTSPHLDPAEIAKERLVVVEEIRMYQDTPQDHVQTLLDEELWPDHPLGREVAGTEASVLAFDRDRCGRHLSREYRPDRLVVSMAGLLHHDRAVELVASRLRNLPTCSGAAFEGEDAAPLNGGARVRLASRPTEQAHVVIGWRAPGYRDADRHALDLLVTLLGDGMSSRLFLNLREAQGVAYDVGATSVKLRDTGSLTIYIGCEPKRADTAMDAAIAELARLATELVSEDELTKARRYLIGRLVVQLEGTGALCSHLGHHELLLGGIVEVDEIIADFERVSPEDVRRVASALIESIPRTAVIGPFRHATRFEKCCQRWWAGKTAADSRSVG